MKSRNRLAGILCLIAQPLLLNVLSIPATAYIIRMLGARGFGEWSVAVTLVGTATLPATLGIRALFVRTVARDPDRAAEALAEQLGLRMLLGLAGVLLAVLGCFFLRYPPVVLRCAAVSGIASLFSIAGITIGDWLQGRERFKALAGVNLVAGLVLTFGSVAAVWRGAGPVGLAIAYVSGPAISFTLLAAVAVRSGWEPRVRGTPRRYAELLREARAIGSLQLLANLQERSEQLLVPKLVGVTAFGHFAAGTIPANRLNVVPDAIGTAFYPSIAQGAVGDPRHAERQVSRLLIASLVACLPTAALVAFMAQPIALLLFPAHADISRRIIQVTIWSVPFSALSMSMLYALQASGKDTAVARAGSSGAVCSLLCSIALVSAGRMEGACWAWLLRPAITAAFLLPTFLQTFRGVPAQVPFARILCALGAMVTLLGLCGKIQMPWWLAVIAGSGLGIAAYAGCLAALKVVTGADIRRVLARPAPAIRE